MGSFVQEETENGLGKRGGILVPGVGTEATVEKCGHNQLEI